mgnify:CR=1 FL=1
MYAKMLDCSPLRVSIIPFSHLQYTRSLPSKQRQLGIHFLHLLSRKPEGGTFRKELLCKVHSNYNRITHWRSN